MIFPQNYQNQAYVLPGYHENSSELVFSRLSPPLALRVAAGEKYWVWYHEDFMDKSEDNNAGRTCVDVYALWMSQGGALTDNWLKMFYVAAIFAQLPELHSGCK